MSAGYMLALTAFALLDMEARVCEQDDDERLTATIKLLDKKTGEVEERTVLF